MNRNPGYTTAMGCLVFLTVLTIGSNYANDNSARLDLDGTCYRKKDGLLSSTELKLGNNGSTSIVQRPFPIFGKSVITDLDGDGKVDEVECSNNPFQRKVYRRIDQINNPHLFDSADAELKAQKKRFQPMITGNAMLRYD
jgi:hypothetical protein